MLLWLSGTDNTKWSPNENYARELMELFTLGVGPRLHRARRPRAGARADGLARTTGSDGVGPTNFRFERERHDTGSKRIFGKRGRFDWRDSCRLCVHHPQHPSFFVDEALGLLHPDAAAARDAARARALYVRSGYEIRPVVEAILKHPAPLRRPADGQAAGRLRGGDAPGAQARDRHRGLDVATAASPASSSSTRRTSRAGTTTAGSTRRPTWPGGTSPDGSRETGSSTRTRCRRRSTPTSCSTGRSRSGATRRSPGRRARALRVASPSARSATANQNWKKAAATRALVENALRQLIAVSPDLQTC